MSAMAKANMRATEKAVYRYYNDMGKQKGNCTWGPGLLAHKGICSEHELKQKVNTKLVDFEFERRVAEAERLVRRKTKVALNQAQFDSMCSLTYNAGLKATRGTYDLVNQGDFSSAAANISRMIKVEINEGGKKKYVIAPGLIRRRAEESAPFRVAGPATASNK
jgi:GH24 family phage-related lysozyme (muramidase)